MKPATMLMHRAALNRDVGLQCGKGFLEAGRAVDDGEWSFQDSNGDGIGDLDGIGSGSIILSGSASMPRHPLNPAAFCLRIS